MEADTFPVSPLEPTSSLYLLSVVNYAVHVFLPLLLTALHIVPKICMIHLFPDRIKCLWISMPKLVFISVVADWS